MGGGVPCGVAGDACFPESPARWALVTARLWRPQCAGLCCGSGFSPRAALRALPGPCGVSTGGVTRTPRSVPLSGQAFRVDSRTPNTHEPGQRSGSLCSEALAGPLRGLGLSGGGGCVCHGAVLGAGGLPTAGIPSSTQSAQDVLRQSPQSTGEASGGPVPTLPPHPCSCPQGL